MAKIVLTDEILDCVCENISNSLEAELLTASKQAQAEIVELVIEALKKKRETDYPQPGFLKSMVLKNPDDNGNRKRC